MTITRAEAFANLHGKYGYMFRVPGTEHQFTPSTGVGWVRLLEELCGAIDAVLTVDQRERFRFEEVKSKYGSLRAYFTLGVADPELEGQIEALVGAAEDLSEQTCETCGAPGRTYDDHGWIITACPQHAKGDPTPPTHRVGGPA